MIPWQAIADRMSSASGERFAPGPPVSIGGGCINDAWLLADGARRWFVKTNRAALVSMFEQERVGLEALRATDTLRIPQPLCAGCEGDCAFLVMEYIAPGSEGADGQRLAGEQLARLHQVTAPDFGWPEDNWIGSTRQVNTEQSNWVEFWHRHRLGFQLELAAGNGYGGSLQVLGEQLLAQLPALLDHAPKPSLLHGDLWGGNLGFDVDGAPFVFDPAVYYGDRETDLAMTGLFGGFSRDFYAAYQSVWPLDAGYPVRKDLYNLYHILNHLNLFGGGYRAQAEGLMQRLLSETR